MKQRVSARVVMGSPRYVAYVADVMVYLSVRGYPMTQRKFCVCRRTLERWKHVLESGKWPELSARVAEMTGKMVSANEALLIRVYDAALNAILARIEAKEGTLAELTTVATECAGIMQAQQMLGAANNVQGTGPNTGKSAAIAADATDDAKIARLKLVPGKSADG